MPELIFDGDCSFCRIWVGYWKMLTGDRVEYAPYQSDAGRFPEVPIDEFRKAVQFFENGQRRSGAEAVFHLLASGSGIRWPLWLYDHMPGAAPASEAVYSFIAAHRNFGYQVTRALWGTQIEPARYSIASSLFSRALAIIYLIAFASFGFQVRGLIGAQGIQPVTEFLAEVTNALGSGGFWRVPTIFWWIHSDFGLLMIVWSGAVIAAVCAVGRPHTPGVRAALVLLFIYYLSAVGAGQIFMGYQWDYLLLETGFLTIFLVPSFPRAWLMRWLLFRLMFESGAVKLLSHDPSWRNLTALSFHYETQPLPTPLAWYMFQLPLGFQKLSTAFVFVVELGLPFLIFGPRRLKHIAAFGIILLEVLILLTGNYTFFNLLTIALCLFLLDDAFLRRRTQSKPALKAPRANRVVSRVLVAGILIISLTGLAGMFGFRMPAILSDTAASAGAFGIVNQYGLFAVMTTDRPEISIEGSNDGTDWQPYIFRDKPGPLNRAPSWVAPLQPRLDWQMWFAALGNYRGNPWLIRFMQRLLEGSQPVLSLLQSNPFGGQPPRFVRAVVYDYRFTTFDERRQTGNWWTRERKGTYFPPISLRTQE